jgi:uncharacterized protein YjbI with pentapeptide repeats
MSGLSAALLVRQIFAWRPEMIDSARPPDSIEPRRAPVTPRVQLPETGDVVPLEEAIAPLEGRAPGAIEIVGGPGSGKTTALEHLAAVIAPDRQVLLLDQPDREQVAREAAAGVVVYTSTTPDFAVTAESFYLARWTDDELIEYLLAIHPDQCGSVMGRVTVAEHRRQLLGLPQLWRIVLDEMAADPSLAGVHDALRRHWESNLDDQTRELAGVHCLASFGASEGLAETLLQRLYGCDCDRRLLSLLRHRVMRVLLAADHLSDALATAEDCPSPAARLPRDLVAETATRIAAAPTALERLGELLAVDAPQDHPMAASLLHAAGAGWTPGRDPIPLLDGAYLQGASWPGLDLSGAQLRKADLTAADLAEATLDRAEAAATCLRHAVLHRASLNHFNAYVADLSYADLSGSTGQAAEFRAADLLHANLEGAELTNADFRSANLAGTRFCRCDLRHAKFVGAKIDGTDFTEANLRWASLRGLNLQTALLGGACLAEADLSRCNLEQVRLPEANLEGAFLRYAWLTGSSMPRANLRNARLRFAGLADVNWEEVDLRDADLRQCTFHMGSSRSGLVGSPIAGEGTRTGFYTDEFDQQHFKAPEEIRKANLRGADLRGAQIEGVDFYLVDLRGAKFTVDQHDHFRRCGAILYDRA